MNFEWSNDLDSDVYRDAIEIRKKVFVDEQNVPEDREIDKYEEDCYHCVGYDNGNPICTARLLPVTPDLVKIQRVAVLAEYRLGGYGRLLIDECIQKAAQERYHTLVLGSQLHATGFYERFGFEKIGEEYEDAGLPHIDMELNINKINDDQY